jgi:site-specific DNA-methyltransferase (adenine-specific)
MLKDTGSLYFHCDPTAGHYVKVMLDYIFGLRNFNNEIIWSYVSGGISKKTFAKKHDKIFFYSKTKDYTFNVQKERPSDYKGETWFDEKGEYIWYIRPGTNPKVPNGVKSYLDKHVRSVWEIPIVNPMAKERLGYPTQKPEPLLERIILASSNEGDLVADFFMGGGTTIAVAERLNRRWIGCDINHRALQITQERLDAITKTK